METEVRHGECVVTAMWAFQIHRRVYSFKNIRQERHYHSAVLPTWGSF
jgi:hypothetical protein